MRWSEEQTVLFVKIYLQHEYLWNTKHEHYGQKYLRKKAYKNIASVFGAATDIWLQEREVMAKLKILGSTYAQEVAKIRKRADTDKPYTPGMRWFHYWHRCKYYNEPITDDLQEPDGQKIWIVAPDSENDNEHDTSHDQDISMEDGESTLKTELEEGAIQDLESLVKQENKNSIPAKIKTPLHSNIKSRWSEDETVKFVQIYLSHEILWNADHPQYRHNNIRKKAYSKISLEFRATTGMVLTDKEVMIKIRSLKSTYSQEVTKIKNKSSADIPYTPTLKWFADWDRHFGSKKHESQDTVYETQDSDDQKVWLEVSEEEESEAEKTENKKPSRGRRWGESDTMKFVKIYLQYEFLYNPKHKYFRQKKLRTEAYNSVSSEFEAATGIKLDEKELKAKIKILGSTYAQELSKIKKRAGTNQPYTPSMKWFSYWHKRKFAMQQRNARVPMNEDAENEAHDAVPEDWSVLNYSSDNEDDDLKSEEEPESPPRQDSEDDFEVDKKRMKLEDSTGRISPNFVDTNSEYLNSTCEREDEFEHYGRYIASILRSMNLEKALQIQLEIQNLLSEARSESIIGGITD